MTTRHFRSELGRMLCVVSVAGTLVTLPARASAETGALSGCPAQPVVTEPRPLEVGSASGSTSGLGFRQSIEAVSSADPIRLDRNRFTADSGETSASSHRTSRKVAGGILGAVAGFFAGGLVGSAIDQGIHSEYSEDPGLMGFLVGAPIGAVVGGCVGVALASR